MYLREAEKKHFKAKTIESALRLFEQIENELLK